MNPFTSASVACAVATALLAPAFAAAAPSDDAQIRALESRFVDAFRARNLDGIMKVYAPDVFVFDVVPPRQFVGAAAYREDWKGLFGMMAGPPKVTLTDLVVSTDGTIGYSHSIQHLSSTNAKGAPMDLTVRVSDVYRKRNGAWRIVQEHVSVPVDLATGKADLSSKP